MKTQNFIFQTIFFAILVTTTCNAQFNYPPTKTVDSCDTYFGVTYQDPYRWLENIKDTTVITWFKQEANFTNDIFNKIPGGNKQIAEREMPDKLQPPGIDPAGYENGRLFYRMTMNTQATVADNPQLGWITLGTQGGPEPNAERSEPANLLIVNGNPWIVDCGDGAMERLAAAGFNPNQVNIAFISHLHMDHIGGLQALIGLRWFMGARSKLTIYGPPGTDVVVSGILQSLKPTVRIGLGIRVHQGPTLEELTQVVILKDNSDLIVDSVRIRAVPNSHFDDPPGHPADNGSQSLSYRFDYKGYAIGYTGDTGPCDAVARLEHGVDLLVSEVIDLPAMIAVFKENPKIPEQAKTAIIQHFNTQHLTPQAAGKIAAEAGVGRLVFTHLSIPGKTNVEAQKLINQAHETFKGEVIVAHDLDRF